MGDFWLFLTIFFVVLIKNVLFCKDFQEALTRSGPEMVYWLGSGSVHLALLEKGLVFFVRNT